MTAQPVDWVLRPYDPERGACIIYDISGREVLSYISRRIRRILKKIGKPRRVLSIELKICPIVTMADNQVLSVIP